MSSPVTRFTTEQVLRGMQVFVAENIDKNLVLDPDASVYYYHDTVVKDFGCPLEFLSEMCENFDLRWDEKRWSVWLKLHRSKRKGQLSRLERMQAWEEWKQQISPSLTVRKLAMYIARHARGVSMEPVTIFGVPCAPAGAFRGLCELPELRGKRVAPSTPIRKMLGASSIETFWARSSWISGAALPRTKKIPWWTLTSSSNWIDALGLGAALVLTLFVSIFVGAKTDLFMNGAFVGIATFIGLLWLTFSISDRVRNPLPDGVTTFGDLARLIANKPQQAIG